MKKIIFIITLMLIFTLLASVQFDPKLSREKTIIACFELSSTIDNSGRINFEKENGTIKTGLESFDEIAKKYGFIDMQQTYPNPKYPEFEDTNGARVQCIYRITTKSNDVLEDAINELMKNEHIIFAEYEAKLFFRMVPNDPYYGQQWFHQNTNVEPLWDYIDQGEGALIGIVDSGVKWDHPDLAANIFTNEPELLSIAGGEQFTIDWENGTFSGGNNIDDEQNGFIDDVIGWSFAQNQTGNNTIQTYAANTHGTHVAGCAAAVTNNGIGVAGSAGPATNIKLIPMRHSPNNYVSDGIYDGYSGIEYCADLGADIINCSWGGPSANGYWANASVNYATNAGALVVAAAGNANTQHTSAYTDYPADCDNVLCVAATDQNDVKADFSDFGSTIDICAPGVNIMETIVENNGYQPLQGTSMASPIVAGIAAAVKSLNPDLTPAQLKERLMMTADYIYNIPGNEVYEGLLGTGRVNGYAAALSHRLPDLNITDLSYEETTADDGVANPGESISINVKIENTILWQTATDISIQMTCDDPNVNIINDTVTYADLYSGSSEWNSDVAFEFTTDEYTSNYNIPFTFIITSNNDAEIPFRKEVTKTITLSLNQENWPVEIGGQSLSAPVILDIDNNGTKELVLGDYAGNVHAYNIDGTELEGFPVALNSPINGALAVADINNDNYKEIVAGTLNGNVNIISYNGELLSSVTVGGPIRTNQIIIDTNNDGFKDILAVTQTGNFAVINHDGNIFDGYPISLGSPVLASPAAGDINNDGHIEFIASLGNGDIVAIDTNTNENIAGFPVNIGSSSWKGPFITNLDNDDELEIVVSTMSTGDLYTINHDGSELSHSTFGQLKSSIVPFDLDENGSVELLFTTANGDFYITNIQGNPLEGFPVSLGASSECTPILADMNDDGIMDALVGDSNGYLHSISMDGSETPNFPYYVSELLPTSAAIDDMDNDGDLDIAIANSSSVNIIDFKRSGIIAWPTFKKNPERTGFAYNPTPTTNESIIPMISRLQQNYPNPFNPTTNIKFSINKPSKVKIEVYNVKGQVVKTLVDRKFESGIHQIVWNGDDNNSQQVGSGIYFYKMTTPNYTESRKMILMK